MRIGPRCPQAAVRQAIVAFPQIGRGLESCRLFAPSLVRSLAGISVVKSPLHQQTPPKSFWYMRRLGPAPTVFFCANGFAGMPPLPYSENRGVHRATLCAVGLRGRRSGSELLWSGSYIFIVVPVRVRIVMRSPSPARALPWGSFLQMRRACPALRWALAA